MMKKLLILLAFVSVLGTVKAQTATNFTCNDCSGVSHDLFTELNAGKVIVIAWVMPCGACSGPALTAYNAVTSYQTSNPGQVFFYMADDYANTVCASLNGWANSAGIPQNAHSLRFSNASINMLDYGATGMPKIIVLGGVNHTVFYNANNTVNPNSLQNAITLALSSTGINEQNADIAALNVYPNPADKTTEIKFNLAKISSVDIELFNLEGKRIDKVFSGQLPVGENKMSINTAPLPAGTYLIKMTSEGTNRFINMVVSH